MHRRFEYRTRRGPMILGLVLSLSIVIIGLLVLPEIGTAAGGLFTLCWMIFGSLIAGGFLAGLLRTETKQPVEVLDGEDVEEERRYGSSS